MTYRTAAAALTLTLAACSGGGAPDNAQAGEGRVVLRNLASTNIAEPRDAHPRNVQGSLIPTPSDTRSRYFLLRERQTPSGNVIAIIRQEQGDQVAYARAEVNCGKRLFHVLGVGPTRAVAEVDAAHDGPLRSIDGLPLREEMARYVCARSGLALGAA